MLVVNLEFLNIVCGLSRFLAVGARGYGVILVVGYSRLRYFI